MEMILKQISKDFNSFIARYSDTVFVVLLYYMNVMSLNVIDDFLFLICICVSSAVYMWSIHIVSAISKYYFKNNSKGLGPQTPGYFFDAIGVGGGLG